MTVKYVMRRRQGASDHELLPGEYRQLARSHRYGDIAHAILRCPLCHGLTLTGYRNHDVNYLGEINPPVGCPSVECEFKALVTLEDWLPVARGSA